MSVEEPRRVIVGVSGASGVVYGVRTLEVLSKIPEIESHLIITKAAKVTLGIETDHAAEYLEGLADQTHALTNIAASVASGSFRTAGMIVAPCSMKTLSAIAHSYSADLLTRAADVTLKERRPLVLMVRETPLHLGHLRLMEQVSEMGAIVFPPVPAFYARPTSLDDVVTHSVARALEHVDVVVHDIDRWRGLPSS